MRNHFNSAHRWNYIIISILGSGHKHYLVSDVVDANSLYPVQNVYDSKYDRYVVIDSSFGDSCSLYEVTIAVDKPGYYSVNNSINKDSLFAIYFRGDYNR